MSYDNERTCNILLLGEGNLTFTFALVKRISASTVFRRHRSAPADITDSRLSCSVLTTTIDSESELVEKYPEVIPIFSYFQSKTRVKVYYSGEVNATKVGESLRQQGHETFIPHVIIFNNPHVGFEDLYRHRSLLSHFFSSVGILANCEGSFTRQIIVALCDDQPARWGVLEAAARNGFICIAAVPLLKNEFPEYENKRHQSDAKFPYQWMIQYYFVATSDFVQRLPHLHDEFLHWHEDESAGRLDCSAWLKVSRAARSDKEKVATMGHDAPCLTDLFAGDMSSISLKHLSLRTCVPLLHPQLAFYCSQSKRPPGKEGFCPYLDVEVLPALYAIQRESESAANSAHTESASLPEHLDTRVLGRELNSREQAKLQRYLKNYNKKASINSPEQSTPAELPPTSLSCVSCSRKFQTTEALDDHMRSKHAGVDVLHPNMHAKAHKQLLSACEGALADERYCRECDLLFDSIEAYDEHIALLTPTSEHVFVCSSCEPPRQFVDERAFVQHKILKHV